MRIIYSQIVKLFLLTTLATNSLYTAQIRAETGFMESARTHMTYSWRARAAGQVVREIKSEYTLCQDGTEGCLYQTEWVEETTWHRDNIFSGSKLIQTLGEGDTPFNDRVIYQTDHLGSPRLSIGKQTDENGVEYEAVLARHTYQPFGEEITESEDKQPLKYTGHERDAEDLDYMRGRYYKPSTGRFLQPDPSRADGWSLYSYAHNNSVRKVDKNGLSAKFVELEDGNIRIELAITFTGEESEGTILTRELHDAISEKWSGTYEIDGKEVNVEVVSFTPTAEDGRPSFNLEIKDESSWLDSVLVGEGRSYVNAATMNGVIILDRRVLTTVAHEAGHLLGAKDHYIEPGIFQDEFGVEEGWSFTLMAGKSRHASDKDMQEVINIQRNLAVQSQHQKQMKDTFLGKKMGGL